MIPFYQKHPNGWTVYTSKGIRSFLNSEGAEFKKLWKELTQ